MPSPVACKLVQGDLNPHMDFRSIYSTIVDKWLHMDPMRIISGTHEQLAFLNRSRGCCCAAEQRDELAASQFIELQASPSAAGEHRSRNEVE
jgi:hypothetical protein